MQQNSATQVTRSPQPKCCKVYECRLASVAAPYNGDRKRGYCNSHHRVVTDDNGQPDCQFNISAPDQQPNWMSANTKAELQKFTSRHLVTYEKRHCSWGPDYDTRMGRPVQEFSPSDLSSGNALPDADLSAACDEIGVDAEWANISDADAPATTTIDAQKACQDLQAVAAQQALPPPAGIAAMQRPTLTPTVPSIHRVQGANGTALLTQGQAPLPQTIVDLPHGTLGYHDKTPENHRSQVQLLIETLVSEAPNKSSMTGAQILDLNFGAALMFKDISVARTERITERFSRYFYSLARAPHTVSVDHLGRCLVSTKTGPNEYSFSFAVSADIHVATAKEQLDLLLRANASFGLLGNELKPQVIGRNTIQTIETTEAFKDWLYQKNGSLNGVMDPFMVNLVIGTQESGKSSFEAARYAYSRKERDVGVHVVLFIGPKSHSKFHVEGSFEPLTMTYEEAKEKNLFETGGALSNHRLGDGGDCQFLIAAHEDQHTYFVEWRQADVTGLRNYGIALKALDQYGTSPLLFKIEEPLSTNYYEYWDKTKRWNQMTSKDISPEPKKEKKFNETMPFVKHVLRDGVRGCGYKGFELTLHKLKDLVAPGQDNIDMNRLTHVLNWVFVVFHSKSEKLWAQDNTGLIQELADKWTEDQRDRLQWYVDTYIEKHDALAIEFFSGGDEPRTTDVFPTNICDTSMPWKKFFVIKGTAYVEHVTDCKDKADKEEPGYLATLYNEATIKGIFK